ncbi:GSCOCG00003249001-RA-CDS [Cotesia congregata]|uniref:Similar to PPP1R42: Protein phosphatase 1 regulatory subunit 42 (Macaca fascicularis) n=1 Tax=Cotesia congregata TaxID=51543 RepID=A0A8J2HM41_COTCN|nr:GSCOCG00003249001-RA-CDS [Cotesia congregata]CAG5108259.1 Similar to PPP1R42: Protein phosphatase 1 regulatory subunit 42 (Macaca fascicularis) [Cotesia congregata]
MVLLTTNYIEKEYARTQYFKSLTKGISKNNLRKMTHLYMNDKFVDAIGNLSGWKNLRVIYLQNNNISKIENLQFTINLTHLYLQHNNIYKIENLNNLYHLKCLFIGYNNICVVEEMENLESLVELNIENQRLLTGESLIFDPKSLNTLSCKLKILNVTGNNICYLKPLSCLYNLEILIAKNNNISEIIDVIETVKVLKSLVELQLENNPVTYKLRYRENIIANSCSLRILDGKSISQMNKYFLNKLKNNKQSQLALRKTHNKISLSDDIKTSLNLPPAFERSISRAILEPGPKLSIGVNSAIANDKLEIYPSWTSTSAIAGKKDNHLTPRPFWKSVNPRQKHQHNHQKFLHIHSQAVIIPCLNKK